MCFKRSTVWNLSCAANSYSKRSQLLYEIGIFGKEYVNRTVSGLSYCMK